MEKDRRDVSLVQFLSSLLPRLVFETEM
jgi:hypothetical protein